MTTKNADIVISFDTTGSMYPCISQVRKNIKSTIERLFKELPQIRIGIVAHGDYCDEDSTYLMKYIDLTSDQNKLIDFIQTIGNTSGGDYPEAYEYVLREVQKLSWQSDDMRGLLMIGDAYPHEPKENPDKIDWRKEVEEIAKMGINIYSIQALNSGNAKCYTFYKQMLQVTNGYHLYLDQFSYITDMIMAVCYKQESDDAVQNFEQELKNKQYGMTNSLRRVFDTILGRKSDIVDDDTSVETKKSSRKKSATVSIGSISKSDVEGDELNTCPASKYQVLHVDNNTTIKDYVIKNGLEFKTGKGFYEFTKPESISSKKQVVLQHKLTGELYEGSKARKIIGLKSDTQKYKPSDNPDYRIFIQSTSYNRKLIGGTGFLYEASDWGKI